MKYWQKKFLKTASVFFCFFGIIAGVHFWYLEEQGNFHPITPGEAYRSAQLDQDELGYYIRKFGIRSIINLRGKNDGERWYTKEIAMCRKFGIKHYDLGLHSDKEPTSHNIQELMRLFYTTPRPVLIHCKAGADRAGLAAAIWEVVIEGRPKSEAKRQLSFVYGHMPFGPVQALDAFFEKWVIPKKTIIDGGEITGGLLNMGNSVKVGKTAGS